MAVLKFQWSNEYLADELLLHELNNEEVWMELYNDYYGHTTSWDITKEQAIQIINHLKEQFDLNE